MRENPAGEAKNGGIRLLFDRRLRLEFRGAKITTDAGLLAVRELDEMMGLTEMAADLIAEGRTGKNIQHLIPGLTAALNDVKPKYVVTDKGYANAHMGELMAQFRADAIVAVRKALKQVKELNINDPD